MTHRPRLLPRRPLWWLGLLLGAWLAAQTLGLVHRPLHGSPGDHFHAQHTAADEQLYDHAGTADLLVGLALALPPVLAAPAPAAALPLARRVVTAPPFLARGPPALR